MHQVHLPFFSVASGMPLFKTKRLVSVYCASLARVAHIDH